MPKLGRRASYLAVAALLISLQALAHHSGAMFDNTKSVTLVGTIKAFQWSNPHCWIQVLVPGASGASEWSVEMGSPSQLFKGGWRPTTLQVGAGIVVVVHPMRDGTQGGLFVSATAADGKPFGTQTQ
jgi:hypothetical protein